MIPSRQTESTHPHRPLGYHKGNSISWSACGNGRQGVDECFLKGAPGRCYRELQTALRKTIFAKRERVSWRNRHIPPFNRVRATRGKRALVWRRRAGIQIAVGVVVLAVALGGSRRGAG